MDTITKEIYIDMTNRSFITINMNQYEKNTRFIKVYCTNDGEFFPITKQKLIIARYAKPDGNSMICNAQAQDDGTILLEITEQMTAVDGLASCEFQIINVTDNSVLCTTTFNIKINKSPVSDKTVISSSEFKSLSDLIIRVENSLMKEDELEAALEQAKDYMDSADESAQHSKISETNAKLSETNAKNSETNAKSSANAASVSALESSQKADAAKASADLAKISETNTKTSETNAKNSAADSASNALLSKSWSVGGTNMRDNEEITNAKYYSSLSKSNADSAADSLNKSKEYALNAKLSETNAKTSEVNASNSVSSAKASADLAKSSADLAAAKLSAVSESAANAKISETNSKSNETSSSSFASKSSESAKLSESYAKGGTNSRIGEDTDNAKYYYEKAKEITGTNNFVLKSSIGAANGIASLDANGKVPATQLPGFVDDVLEYTSKTAFPTPGESGKIYIDSSANLTYRWNGTTYVLLSFSLALGETSSTAYRGDYGKTAYTHSQLVSGNPHKVSKTDIGLSSVPNVTTNNQTPTWSIASALTALTSGESLSAALGKIAKAISSLMTHLADSVIHITAAERTKWNMAATTAGNNTTNINSINEQISELKKSVSDGKTLVANAITAKGVSTAATAEFATMANNIGKISNLSNLQTAECAAISDDDTGYVNGVHGKVRFSINFPTDVLGITAITCSGKLSGNNTSDTYYQGVCDLNISGKTVSGIVREHDIDSYVKVTAYCK